MGGERRTARESVAAAAADLFAEQGYARTTIREIAARASVDPALVIRYSGSKEALFVDAMTSRAGAALDLDGPLDGLGERIVRYVLEADDGLRSTYLALVRASDADRVGSLLRTFHDEAFVSPLLARLTGPDREVRARLVAAMVGGLMYALWTVGDDALRAVPTAQVVDVYAPGIQRLVTRRGDRP
ncbi:TetR family transcriptional regulator [Actinotalea subterranea]|uniref:TetR/AcrR family transcriptional regulator n=1 Tax=Actinotalea subterranea TaxID=2607497 RepID=UPI0011EF9E58|nr:TetR family transcriptional regulator [Actinotalea subterranea]